MDWEMLSSFKWFFGSLGTVMAGVGIYVRCFSYDPLLSGRISDHREWADKWSLVFFGLALGMLAAAYFARGWANLLEQIDNEQQEAAQAKKANEEEEARIAKMRSFHYRQLGEVYKVSRQ